MWTITSAGNSDLSAEGIECIQYLGRGIDNILKIKSFSLRKPSRDHFESEN